MVAKRGSDVTISRGDAASPEVFTAVGAVQNCTPSISGDPIDVTTGDDVVAGEIWRTHITGVKDFEVSCDGITKAFLPMQTIYNDFATGAITNYEIVVPNIGTWTVAMIVGSMDFPGPYDGPSGFSLTLKANGAPTFVAET